MSSFFIIYYVLVPARLFSGECKMTIRAKLEEKIKVCEKTQKRAEIAGLDYLSLYYAGLGDACNWMLTLLKISKIEVSQNEFRVKELQEKI